MEEQKPVWKFVDSALTGVGIGVVVGSAIVSPPWFLYIFIFGGIALEISFLRVKAYKDRIGLRRMVPNIVICLCIATGWALLWKVIPRPKEPPAKEEIAQAVSDKLNGTAGQGPSKAANEVADAVIAKLRTSDNEDATGKSSDKEIRQLLIESAINQGRSLKEIAEEWKQKDDLAYDEGFQSSSSYDFRSSALRHDYSERIRRLMSDASRVRQQILKKLSATDNPGAEKQEDAIFADLAAGKDINYWDVNFTGDYLMKIANALAKASGFPAS
jgi:hypothetical protein